MSGPSSCRSHVAAALASSGKYGRVVGLVDIGPLHTRQARPLRTADARSRSAAPVGPLRQSSTASLPAPCQPELSCDAQGDALSRRTAIEHAKVRSVATQHRQCTDRTHPSQTRPAPTHLQLRRRSAAAWHGGAVRLRPGRRCRCDSHALFAPCAFRAGRRCGGGHLERSRCAHI